MIDLVNILSSQWSLGSRTQVDNRKNIFAIVIGDKEEKIAPLTGKNVSFMIKSFSLRTSIFLLYRILHSLAENESNSHGI